MQTSFASECLTRLNTNSYSNDLSFTIYKGNITTYKRTHITPRDVLISKLNKWSLGTEVNFKRTFITWGSVSAGAYKRFRVCSETSRLFREKYSGVTRKKIEMSRHKALCGRVYFCRCTKAHLNLARHSNLVPPGSRYSTALGLLIAGKQWSIQWMHSVAQDMKYHMFLFSYLQRL